MGHSSTPHRLFLHFIGRNLVTRPLSVRNPGRIAEFSAGERREEIWSRITHVPRCCPTSRAKIKLTAVLAGWVPIKESSGSFGKRAARGLRLIILPDFSCQL